jgi:hypothetical protein
VEGLAVSARRLATIALALCPFLASGSRAATLHTGDIVMAGTVSRPAGGDDIQVLSLNPSTLDTTVISRGGLITWPYDVAVGPGGRILVASGNAGVIEVDAATGAQRVLTSAGQLGGDAAGLCFAPNGDVFVSLRGSTPGIARMAGDGSGASILTSGDQISYPGGIAIGPEGALYVAEGGLPTDNGTTPGGIHGRGSIVRVDPGTGGQTRVAADSLFVSPYEIAFVAPDEVWTTQAGAVAGRRGCFIRTNIHDGLSAQAEDAPPYCRSLGIGVALDGTRIVSDCATIGPDCYYPFTQRIPGGPTLNGVAGRMAVVPEGVVPVRRASWGTLKTIYR